MHRLYFALWDGNLLYRFDSLESCQSFFRHENPSAKARGCIDLQDVVSVRVSKRRNLPHAGIELVGLKRTWLVIPEGGDEDFVRWLQVLGDAVGQRNRRLYEETKDNELLREVGNVDPSRLNAQSCKAMMLLNRGKRNLALLSAEERNEFEALGRRAGLVRDDVDYPNKDNDDHEDNEDNEDNKDFGDVPGESSPIRGGMERDARSNGDHSSPSLPLLISPRPLFRKGTRNATMPSQVTNHGWIQLNKVVEGSVREGSQTSTKTNPVCYGALWNNDTLYTFESPEQCALFFRNGRGPNDDAALHLTHSQIELESIVGLRVATSFSDDGRRADQRIRLVGPEACWSVVPQADDEFPSWLGAFAAAIRSHNVRLHNETGDGELLNELGDVDPTALSPMTLELMSFLRQARDGQPGQKGGASGLPGTGERQCYHGAVTPRAGHAIVVEPHGRCGDEGHTVMRRLPLPMSTVRSLDHLTHHGWMQKESTGLRRRMRRRYFALWHSSILYRFDSREACEAFFRTGGSPEQPRGHIDMEDIVGIRVSQRRNLPHPGIELMGVTRSWLVCPEGGRGSFVRWLEVLGAATHTHNQRLHRHTGDTALLQDVGEVDPHNLSERTRAALRILGRGKEDPGSLSSSEREHFDRLRAEQVRQGSAHGSLQYIEVSRPSTHGYSQRGNGGHGDDGHGHSSSSSRTQRPGQSWVSGIGQGNDANAAQRGSMYDDGDGRGGRGGGRSGRMADTDSSHSTLLAEADVTSTLMNPMSPRGMSPTRSGTPGSSRRDHRRNVQPGQGWEGTHGSTEHSLASPHVFPLRRPRGAVDVTMHGWLMLEAQCDDGSRNMVRRYFALWGGRMLSSFHGARACGVFFGNVAPAGPEEKVHPLDQIDLATIHQVSVSPRHDLPHPGIDMRSSLLLPGSMQGSPRQGDAEAHVLCPENEDDFVHWLAALSNAVRQLSNPDVSLDMSSSSPRSHRGGSPSREAFMAGGDTLASHGGDAAGHPGTPGSPGTWNGVQEATWLRLVSDSIYELLASPENVARIRAFHFFGPMYLARIVSREAGEGAAGEDRPGGDVSPRLPMPQEIHDLLDAVHAAGDLSPRVVVLALVMLRMLVGADDAAMGNRRRPCVVLHEDNWALACATVFGLAAEVWDPLSAASSSAWRIAASSSNCPAQLALSPQVAAQVEGEVARALRRGVRTHVSQHMPRVGKLYKQQHHMLRHVCTEAGIWLTSKPLSRDALGQMTEGLVRCDLSTPLLEE